MNWDVIRSLYSSPGLTPRDWASHFKLVLHRAFFVRRINSDAPNPRCRCCGRELESLAHFASCSVLGNVWRKFDLLHRNSHTKDKAYRLFAVANGGLLPRGQADLHIITWKFILISLTRRDLYPSSPQCRLYVGSWMLEDSSVMLETVFNPFQGRSRAPQTFYMLARVPLGSECAVESRHLHRFGLEAT